MVSLIAELRASIRAPLSIASWVFLTVLMAIAGPFGSYDHIPFVHRLLLWACLSALAITVALTIRVIVQERLGLVGYWRGSSVTAVLVSAVVTFPVEAVMRTLTAATGYMGPAPAELAAFIFCLSMGFCAFHHATKPVLRAADSLAAAAASPETTDPAPGPDRDASPPRLMQRLPADARGRLIRISGRDHYVDIVTERGTSSLLMRFTDALAELEGVEGHQVHRSHWVAVEAVRAAERDRGRHFLILADGTRVPVSRRNRGILATLPVGQA